MTVITLVYSAVALYNLGDMKAPQTFEDVDENSEIVLELPQETDISDMSIYLGAQNLDDSKTLTISFYGDDNILTHDETLTEGNVFYWNNYEFSKVAKKGKKPRRL